MEENRFEKQVQAKMEELRLVPSDAVWAKVDKEINKKKKRSRSFFWFFLFAVLLLAVTGSFLLWEKENPPVAVLGKPIGIKRQESSKDALHNLGGKDTGLRKTEYNLEKLSVVKENQRMPSELKRKTTGIKALPASLPGAEAADKPKQNNLSSAGSFTGNKKPDDKDLPTNDRPGQEKSGNLAGNEEREKVSKKENAADPVNPPGLPEVNKTGIAANEQVIKKDSQPVPKIAQQKKPTKNSPGLETGFSINAGLSTIDQSLFRSAYVTPLNYASTVFGNAGYPVTNNPPSRIYADFSFAAAFFVKKQLSKRLSFSAGIGYHYYSTKIYTGKAVDSLALVYTAGILTNYPANYTLSAVVPNSPYLLRVSGYYANDKTSQYINQYHFLILPLAMNFQLNKGRLLPLVLEAGLSFTYLIKSNALHFDPLSNVYYQDNKLLNKMVLQGTTAVLAGFHISKNELKLGPQIEYGITGLLNKSASNPEHLFYGGLKAIFIPHKK
jgi:hypothetical protein